MVNRDVTDVCDRVACVCERCRSAVKEPLGKAARACVFICWLVELCLLVCYITRDKKYN